MPTAEWEWAAPAALDQGPRRDDPDATLEQEWNPGQLHPGDPPAAVGDAGTDAGPDGDLRACPTCGDPLTAADLFCEACGSPVQGPGGPPDTVAPAAVAIRGDAAAACGACGSRSISPDGYCEHCGARQRQAEDRVEADLGGLAGVSDRGRRHRDNEDAMALWQAVGPDGDACAVAVVCDGVSSSDRPRQASHSAAEAAMDILAAAAAAGTDPETASRSAAASAAAAVAALEEPAARPPGHPEPTPPSCTYVSAVVTATSVTVAWVGDSRAYWLADPSAGRPPPACLTEDDSWAGRMVAWGLMAEDEAFADPRAHALARWLGADAQDPEPRLVTITPTGPGAVMLCSDGLWNYLPDAAELSAVALPDALTQPLESARTLARVALDGGGRDNITVVVLPFPPRSGLPGRSIP